MNETDPRIRFEHQRRRLADAAAAHPEVIGVVAFGSTADLARVDEWSDHDIAVITVAGAEARFRHDLTWLPDAARIVLAVVDQHDGVTVIFEDGGVIEFGAATLEDFAGWAGNTAQALLDRGGVASAVAEMVARPAPGDAVDVARATRIALAKLLIGSGRARRGELLTASHNIRGEAVEHLLAALAAALPGDRGLLDTLDPRRRFERVHPLVGARIERALRHDPETAARLLLGIAEEQLGARSDFPAAGAAAIRRRLGWDPPSA